MNSTSQTSITPRTWLQFLRAQLRPRSLVLILLGLFALFACWYLSRPSFDDIVAKVRQLGGTVEIGAREPLFDFLPDFVTNSIGEIPGDPFVEITLEDPASVENHAAILKLLTRIRHVTELKISGSHIRDEDLSVLAGVKGLDSVDISSTQLRGSCLKYLQPHIQLSNLRIHSESLDESVTQWASSIPHSVRKLELAGPGITDEAVTKLEQLEYLYELRLIGGRLTGGTLAGLSSIGISDLNLDGNPVTDEGASNLAGFDSLESLDLSQTHVTDAGVRKLALLTTLKRLDLKNTPVTGAGFNQLYKFENLYTLKLDGAAVTDAGLDVMQPLPSLRSLSLNQTGVTDAAIPALARHPRLSSLGLQGCNITGGGFANAPVDSLEQIELRGSGMTDENLRHLRLLPNLISLDVRDTAISDQGLVHLIDWKALRELDISWTRVTPTGLLRLAALCPRVKVIHESTPEEIGRPIQESSDTFRIKELGGSVYVSEQRITRPNQPLSDPDEWRNRVHLSLGETKESANVSEIFSLLPVPYTVTEIKIQNDSVTDDMLHVLNTLPNLRWLWIESKLVTGEFLSHLSGLQYLESVEVVSPALDRSVANGIRSLPSTLKELSLQGPGLRDEDLPHLSRLTQLKTLRLACPELTWTGVAQVLAATNLTSLDLAQANVSEEAIRAIAAEPQLEELYFTDAKITDEMLAPLASLSRLNALGLARTQVTDAGLRHVAQLPLLQVLICGETGVTGSAFAEPGCFPALWMLELGNANITDEGLAAMLPLPELMNLGIERNAISWRGIATISRQPKLRGLNISDIPLGNDQVAAFPKFGTLVHLIANNCELKDDGLKFLSGFSNLDRLSLGGNRITGTGLRGLSFPQLQFLDLSSCDITDDGLPDADTFPRLETLHVNKCPITNAALDKLEGLKFIKLLGLRQTAVTGARTKQFREKHIQVTIRLDEK